MDSEAQMKAAIEALTAQQAAWQAGNIDLLKAFETRMDAVLDHLRPASPDGSALMSSVAGNKASMTRHLVATRDSNDDVIERELIALRDAIHFGRGGSREPAPRSAWELIPQRYGNLHVVPPIPAYPEGLEAQVRAVADATGLHAVRGNTYWAIRPDGPDKGTSLRDVVEKYGATGAAYGGDSNNDGPAFRMIQELNAEGIPGVGILSTGTHTSPSLKALATLEVLGARGVLTVLQEVARTPSPPLG